MFTRDNIYYIALSGGDFWLCNPLNLSADSLITPPADYELNNPFSCATGPDSNQIYFVARNLISFDFELVPYDFSNFYTQFALRPSNVPSASTRGVNFGGWFINDASSYAGANPIGSAKYIDMGEPDWPGGGYLVLQREGSDFHIVEEETYPIRIDISNYSPL